MFRLEVSHFQALTIFLPDGYKFFPGGKVRPGRAVDH